MARLLEKQSQNNILRFQSACPRDTVAHGRYPLSEYITLLMPWRLCSVLLACAALPTSRQSGIRSVPRAGLHRPLAAIADKGVLSARFHRLVEVIDLGVKLVGMAGRGGLPGLRRRGDPRSCRPARATMRGRTSTSRRGGIPGGADGCRGGACGEGSAGDDATGNRDVHIVVTGEPFELSAFVKQHAGHQQLAVDLRPKLKGVFARARSTPRECSMGMIGDASGGISRKRAAGLVSRKKQRRRAASCRPGTPQAAFQTARHKTSSSLEVAASSRDGSDSAERAMR
jgi:hypothetical protein